MEIEIEIENNRKVGSTTLRDEVYKKNINQTIADEEIDLLELAIKIINILKNRYQIIFYCLILGNIIGVIYFEFSKPVYRNSIMIRSEWLSRDQLQFMILQLQNRIDQGETKAVSEVMGLTEDKVSKIKHISLVGENSGESDSGNYLLELHLFGNQDFSNYESALVNYLKTNEYVAEKVLWERNMTEKLLESIKNEHTEITQVQKEIRDILKGQQRISSPFIMQNISSLNQEKIILKEKEFELLQKLEFNKPIELIHGFNQKGVSAHAGLLKVASLSSGGAIIIAIVIIVLLEFFALIKGRRPSWGHERNENLR